MTRRTRTKSRPEEYDEQVERVCNETLSVITQLRGALHSLEKGFEEREEDLAWLGTRNGDDH